MKKLTVEITDEAHEELLKIQLQRKLKKLPRATVKDIASDFLTSKLEELKTKNPTE
jgi:hypothetical protein